LRRTLGLALAGAACIIALSVWQLGAVAPLPVAPELVVDRAYEARSDTLRNGEALGTLLLRSGVRPADIASVIAAIPGLNPRRLPAGLVLDFEYQLEDSVPARFSTRVADDRIVQVSRAADGRWVSTSTPVAWQVEQFRVTGAIAASLYEALHDAVLDTVLPRAEIDRFIAELADDVFGWEIDFTRDVSAGDQFHIVYERLVSSEGDVRFGRLVAARVDTRGVPNRAYVMSDDQGRNAYYDERGVSLRRAFKRYPVSFLRISSGYSTRRRHPVLGIWRSHRGTDYAARTGTEIRATADGVVRFAGRNGGYGLMVALRHPRGIETRYAHMSRIASGIAPGARVRQEQVIGYVGSSGLANGPHVHYEFLKNGRHLNPQRVDLGDGTPLPQDRREEFDRVVARYDPLLDPPDAEQFLAAGDR
jgi:murein DD-endopeptidase MepM/ murein hydrolase activator NlpD